jgi:predicted nucleotidyltransferase component of viral defense system
MNIAQEILKLKRQVLKPTISTEEFKRIQVEIEKLKSLGKKAPSVPEPATEILEFDKKDLQNENDVFQDDFSAKSEVVTSGENDQKNEREVMEDAVCHHDTRTGVINNQRRAELMVDYKKELEEELRSLVVRADEMIRAEEIRAELEHIEPRTLYDLDSKLSERIAKLKRQIAGYEKRIKECLANPHGV